jgi:hypothetical protein
MRSAWARGRDAGNLNFTHEPRERSLPPALAEPAVGFP